MRLHQEQPSGELGIGLWESHSLGVNALAAILPSYYFPLQ